MRIVARALGFLMCWLLLPASASAAGGEDTCSRSRAAEVTIEAVRARHDAWSGRCVRLRGIVIGRRLFADRLATLEPKSGDDETVRRSIVLYPGGRYNGERQPALVEITGTIGSCADHHAAVAANQAEHPDEILMVSGYCHTSLESYIRPVVAQVLSRAPIARLVEAEVPLERRELVEAPPGLAGRAEHLSAAREMVAAIATGDELVFRRLDRPDLQHALEGLGSEAAPDWVQREIREVHTDFAGMAALRRDFAAVQARTEGSERVLVNRAELETGMPARQLSLVTCWCKTANCAGLWPIAETDADNRPDRPYLCARTNGYLLGPNAGEAIQVRVGCTEGGLAEPAVGHGRTERSEASRARSAISRCQARPLTRHSPPYRDDRRSSAESLG
ncbi:hypothetical protein [Sphingosinicella sp. BN140058]|uniref:hypothetical protein n=1 Tax=Sphingosinicella sp. BN140058 TaxID=1892855 RepID=UPI0013EA4603|nr:hypothetical protein [Sphingosinicella sp. BN140058]